MDKHSVLTHNGKTTTMVPYFFNPTLQVWLNSWCSHPKADPPLHKYLTSGCHLIRCRKFSLNILAPLTNTLFASMQSSKKQIKKSNKNRGSSKGLYLHCPSKNWTHHKVPYQEESGSWFDVSLNEPAKHCFNFSSLHFTSPPAHCSQMASPIPLGPS